MTQIHQFVHSFVDHDATSTHARHLQRLLSDMGIRSEVYAHEWRGARSQATNFSNYTSRGVTKDTWLLYQLATASDIPEFLQTRPEHVAVNYHNITPAEMIRPWEPTIAAELDRAREELTTFAPRSEFAIGVSKFNQSELIELGYQPTTVAPVLFDPEEFHREIDQKTDARLQKMKQRGGADWLFVGRVAPHKCLHDVVKAFALYQRLYDEKARLHLVGALWSHRYWVILNEYINALDVADAVDLTKGVSNEALGAYYKNADVFVYLSEHEGFGVPALEAFHANVPVVGFDAAAIAETMGNGGIVLADKSPAIVAAAVDRIMHDAGLRESMQRAGRARLGDFTLAKSQTRWREVIEEMVREQ